VTAADLKAGLKVEGATEATVDIDAMGQAARRAFDAVRGATAEDRTKAIAGMAVALRDRAKEVLAENALDLEAARAADIGAAKIDRLALDPKRLEGVAKALDDIAAQTDPVGEEIARWTRPNGLDIARVRTPIGVIGIIYESRPNVTADAAALSVRAGNVVILRGGSEAHRSNAAIHRALADGLKASRLPVEAVQLVGSTDRALVGKILGGLNGTVDLVIPRGGKSLVERVMKEARVAVLAHLDGNCHVYVHAKADPAKARAIMLNAKMRRTGVCGAAETLLIDAAVARDLLPPIADDLVKAGCELRGDGRARSIVPTMKSADESDWYTEYLDAILAVRVIDGLDDAVAHIGRYGSSHTESIVTEDKAAAEEFLTRVDSAIVLHNASTQFADGGEFGMGAEIGIATGRLHARGPVGAEQLTTFKYVVRGNGQVRP
jgi:glutamate-5-semialdehyde dehydrogenase